MKRLKIVIILVMCLVLFPVIVALCQTAKDFVPLLINLPGWKGSEPETVEFTVQDMKGIVVSREYSNDSQSLNAGIMVGQQAAGVWNPSYREGLKVEAGDNLMEVKKQNGYVVLHTYNGDDKAGMVVVLLQEVAPDGSSGAVFVFSYDGINDTEGEKLAQKFDWAKMKSKIK